MPRQTSFQATEATDRQLADLRNAGFGTTTDVIRIAVDRMYREEKHTMQSNAKQYNITKIDVEFSRGSFEDWANRFEEQDADDIARWGAAYNEQIADALRKAFPHATDVTVGEGYDQMMNTKYTFEWVEAAGGEYTSDPDLAELTIQEQAREDVAAIIVQVSHDGSFWDA